MSYPEFSMINLNSKQAGSKNEEEKAIESSVVDESSARLHLSSQYSCDFDEEKGNDDVKSKEIDEASIEIRETVDVVAHSQRPS